MNSIYEKLDTTDYFMVTDIKPIFYPCYLTSSLF